MNFKEFIMKEKVKLKFEIRKYPESVYTTPITKYQNFNVIPRHFIYITFTLFIGYTILQIISITLFTGVEWTRIIILLGWIIPGIVGINVLLSSVFNKEMLFLRFRHLSKEGGIVLSLTFLVLIPMIMTSQWRGWDWYYTFIEAPISGITQELFFRAVLLPVCLKIFQEKIKLGIIFHSVLFSLWHIGVFWTAPIGAAIFVCLVPFVAGLAWGWEAQRDKTIIWTILVHTLILVISSFFIWE